jgi:hypothetical protein
MSADKGLTMARWVLGRCWLLTVLATLLAGATTITGPVAGYVELGGSVLRAIYGVPGSFRFGDPLILPDGTSRIHIAPGQDFAIAERTGPGVSVLFLSGGAVDRVTPVEGAIAPDWVAFSPGAGSAVLFSAASGRLQVVRGLPDTPRVAFDLDSASLGDTARTAAVSDDGRTLMVASRRAVYLVPPGGGPAQVLLTGSEIGSLALFRRGTDAAVWDALTGAIHLLSNVTSAPVDRVVASGWKGFGKLYPSWDGMTIFLVRRGVKSVSAIDIASGEAQSFEIPSTAVTLDPLRNRDTFLISGGRGQPGWVFYPGGDTGRVVFIPAPKPVSESMP